MEDNTTIEYTCLCSIGVKTTVVSITCGTLSNIAILFLLVKSKMIQDTTGKILCNEAVADIVLNFCMAVMLCTNTYERQVQIYMLPVGTGLSCIKAFSLMGISTMLYIAICRPLLYRIYVLPHRVNIMLACLWIWIPVMVGLSSADGTFYKRNEISGCIDPFYSTTNWWVGAINVMGILCLPFVVIVIFAVKITRHHSDLVLMGGQNCSTTEGKVRLAKLTVILFILTVLSQIPLHVIAALHISIKLVLGACSVLYFMYPSAKLFFYLYTLHNFRRAAIRTIRCCDHRKLFKGKSSSGTRSTISDDTKLSICSDK